MEGTQLPSILPLAERMELAVAYKIQNPLASIRNVAHTFEVPRSSLGHRIKGRRDAKTYHQGRQRLTVLEEASLVKWMTQLMNWGWPLSISQLERMATHLLICKGDREPLGQHWYEAFLARHPDFRLEYSKALDQGRKDITDSESYRKWFDLYTSTIKKYGILPGDQYNMGEKGIAMGIIDSGKVIVSKNAISRCMAQPNREWAFLIECISDGGFVVPTYIIFAGKRVMEEWAKSFPDPQATIRVSDKGWTDNEIGVHWLRDTFDLYTKSRTTGSHRLLILDGHGSHVSPEFVEYAAQNNIVPLCLPSRSAYHLQPLDVGLFSPLTNAYKRRLRETSIYGAVNVTKGQFLEILYGARLEAFTPANIAGAWRGAGLIPYDPAVVISKVQPISASATLTDSHGNTVSVTASTSAAAARIDSLVAEIRRGEQSSCMNDGHL